MYKEEENFYFKDLGINAEAQQIYVRYNKDSIYARVEVNR